MVQVPAWCENCQTYLENPGAIELGSNVHFVGMNNRVQCPRCGAMARMLDGEFRVIGEALHLLSAPDWTLTTLRRVADLLGEIEEKKDVSSVADELEEVSPEVAGWLRRVAANWTTGYTLTVIQIIVAIVIPLVTTWIIYGGKADDAELLRNVEQQVTEQIEERLREAGLPPSGQPVRPDSPQQQPPAPMQPEGTH